MRFGDPIKQSVKEISSDLETKETHGNKLKMALKNYRNKLTNLTLLERHLFKRTFGHQYLELDASWNPCWQIDIDID